MKNSKNGMAHLVAVVASLICCAEAVTAQQGGDPRLPPPAFDPALVFKVGPEVVSPYGIAAADILDVNGNAGQDGYPEIAVAGVGVDVFDPQAFTGCEFAPAPARVVKVFHNRGGNPAHAWDGADPLSALAEVQQLSIHAAWPDRWAMEVAFADVTGSNGADLVLVGADPDASGSSPKGFLVVYPNLGNGLFDSTPSVFTTTEAELRGLIAADLNLDGQIDIVASVNDLRGDGSVCPSGEQDLVVVFRNMSNQFGLAFQPQVISLNTANGGPSGDIVVADFAALMPGQPLMDMVTPNPADQGVSSITNLGNMIFDAQVVDPPPGCVPGWYYVSAASGRFGADLDWDFAAVHTADPHSLRVYVDVFKGNGLGSFDAVCGPPPGYLLEEQGNEPELHTHGIATARLGASAYPSLVVAMWRDQVAGVSETPAKVGVLLGKGDGTFQVQPDGLSYRFETVETHTVNVATADLDHNGFDDVIAVNHNYNPDLMSYTITVLINSYEATAIGP